MGKARRRILCAFCGIDRMVNRKRSLSIMDFFWAGLSAVLLMFVVFRGFDPRVFLFSVFCIALAEFFVRVRWRVNLLCPHCGFDPVTYKRSPERAAERVRLHLQRRKDDPRYLLARPLNLPFAKPPPAESQPGSAAKTNTTPSPSAGRPTPDLAAPQIEQANP
jgi:hypothetical protein